MTAVVKLPASAWASFPIQGGQGSLLGQEILKSTASRSDTVFFAIKVIEQWTGFYEDNGDRHGL